MASFSSCVAGLQEAAVRAGVSRSVASRALDIAQPDEKVLRLSEAQPEFKTPIWDYLGFLVDEQRVADGDGRRDLVRSVADALGSTANYLKRSGWRLGGSWMIEVTVPRGDEGLLETRLGG